MTTDHLDRRWFVPLPLVRAAQHNVHLTDDDGIEPGVACERKDGVEGLKRTHSFRVVPTDCCIEPTGHRTSYREEHIGEGYKQKINVERTASGLGGGQDAEKDYEREDSSDAGDGAPCHPYDELNLRRCISFVLCA